AGPAKALHSSGKTNRPRGRCRLGSIRRRDLEQFIRLHHRIVAATRIELTVHLAELAQGRQRNGVPESGTVLAWRRMRSTGCALAANGHAAAPPISVMKSRLRN